MEHVNITQKLISVVKQTPYQFTLQIEVTCGGIEPQFLKQKLYPLQHKLPTKKQKPPQHPKSKSSR
jgi:hypothetical protein